MVTLGITGGIACGKTLVLEHFKRLGAYCIDCDAIVDALYKRRDIQERLMKEFGTADKKELAKLVFKDSAMRKKLEALIQPEVIEELKRKLARVKKQNKVVAVEVPLLFELSLENLFDAIIVVKAGRELQIKRLMESGLTKQEALERINAQMPLAEKIKKADFVIDNSSTYKELAEKVEKIFSKVTG
jgi:dephospho-CoA kinase